MCHDPPLLDTAKAFISALGFQVGPRSFSASVTFGDSVWVRARTASSKMGLSRQFRYGSEQIRGRIQFGGNMWLGSSVVECSHGKRDTLGSSRGRATFFFRPCDIFSGIPVL